MKKYDFRPVSDEMYTITQCTPERMEGEMWLGRGAGGPPIHIHPAQQEDLELREGKLNIYRGGKWETIEAGTKWIIPAGEAHTFKASQDEDAIVKFAVTPAGNFDGFLSDTYDLIKSGKMKNYESLDGLIYSSMIVKKYPDTFRAAQPHLRLIMGFASFMGRIMGKRI